MSIRKTSESERVINLDGPQGNAYALLGYAKDFCKQTGWKWDEIHADLTRSDYKNLVRTFDRYFGEYVTLETEQEDLLDA